MAKNGHDIKKIVKDVTAAANKKFGRDWSMIVRNEGGLMIEARHSSGNVAQSVVWHNGRMESRTVVAKV